MSTHIVASPTATDEEVKKRVHKKLRKKKEFAANMDLPENLRHDQDSSEEDLTTATQGPPMLMNMNQSILGLIAAAGSRVNFNDRFEGHSSDEDDGDDNSPSQDSSSSGQLAHTTSLNGMEIPPKKAGRHQRKFSEHRLLRSLSTLPRMSRLKSSKSKRESSKLSTSPVKDSSDTSDHPMSLDGEETRLPPVMSRMLEARAEMSSRPSFDLDRAAGEEPRESDPAVPGPSPLARKLKEIFEFEQPEEVIEEYPCWLLQSVLLQGYMYITARHICFYSYLPKKAHEVAKAGYLAKSGKRNPKYNRYWFRLKGDVLAYYQDPSNLYFPHGQIDLRYAISASITDKNKDAVHFSVATHHRTYHFKADSAPSAKEWVKSLQRVIFRSHNDGDSVKISLPIENVIDIEDTQMLLEFADTCKIRVIDNDETYAMDEYFFSFFSLGKEAISVLKILVEDASVRHQHAPKIALPVEDDGSGHPAQQRQQMHETKPCSGPDRIRLAKLPEPVKATLSPISPTTPANASPRGSMDVTRSSFEAFRFGRRSLDLPGVGRESSPRRSFSGSRRSLSKNRGADKRVPEKQGSSDSYVQSLDDPSVSALVSSTEDPSASQILRGSEVFHRPSLQRSVSASRPRDQRRPEVSRHKTTAVPSLGPYSRVHAATTGELASPGVDERLERQVAPAPTLQSITRMGAYPLQRAGAFADYLTKTSRQMSSLLASESMGYVEKVSGMWKGGRKHYDEPMPLNTDDDDFEGEDGAGKHATANERFRAHFALPETEKLQATYFGYFLRVLPLYGKIYISDRSFCFRSLLPGTRTKLILPLKDLENVDKEKGFRFGYSGLVVVIRGHEELFFEFGQADTRDDCAITLLQALETTRYLQESGLLRQSEQEYEEAAKAERDALKEARQEQHPERDIRLPRQSSGLNDGPTILFDDPKASLLNFKPPHPLKITCLTIGSRGDVQPYIALCKGLLAEGHKPRIATHAEFQGWIESYGIEFAKVDGDPAGLMRLCIENGTFTLAFWREANSTFRGWLDCLLASAWTACQGADVLIESPSAMAGIHIAEALSIPYFRAFTMPWTRTRAYPHSFIFPEYKMGGAYNYMTYVMFDNVFWKATAYQINRWRNNTLKLPNTNLEKMQPNKVPFLYNFSPSVVAPPLDFSDWIRVTGYWFLDERERWEPPRELVDFIARAREDDKKIVYVGFGSIIVNDPAKLTQEVIDAVQKADVRCILSKGWSERMSKQATAEATAPRREEPKMPPEIHVIKSAPHDWLFGQIDAAAHHGGSGTTGASLRAGIPTIIRPFFGDQFLFGSRVEDIGVGICLKKWGAVSFGRALWEATHDGRMIAKARVLGEQIRREHGVDLAIQCIYRDMEYAKSLIKRRADKNAHAEDEEEAEESWTFVGTDEPDPEVTTRRFSEMGA